METRPMRRREMHEQIPEDELSWEFLEKRATRIILNYYRDTDTPPLPESLKKLKYETCLVQNNKYIRRVPNAINYMSNLVELNLGFCRLIDESIPETLFQITGIEKLNLMQNNLTKLSSGIGNFKSLKEFHVGHNDLHMLPEELYECTLVEKFYVNNNPNLGSISEGFGNLSKIITADLSECGLTKLPKSIGNLGCLNYSCGIDMKGNKFASFPDGIRKIQYSIDIFTSYLYENMIRAAEARVESRVQRRITILGAKAAPPPEGADDEAIEKHYNQNIYQVLLDPVLREMIAVYMHWN